MLIGLNVGPAGFCAYGAQAQSNFLFILVHLDDLEVVLLAGLQLYRTAVRISGFRVVAKPFDAIGNLNERAELRKPQYLSMDYVPNTVRAEERLPGIWLKLLDAQ